MRARTQREYPPSATYQRPGTREREREPTRRERLGPEPGRPPLPAPRRSSRHEGYNFIREKRNVAGIAATGADLYLCGEFQHLRAALLPDPLYLSASSLSRWSGWISPVKSGRGTSSAQPAAASPRPEWFCAGGHATIASPHTKLPADTSARGSVGGCSAAWTATAAMSARQSGGPDDSAVRLPRLPDPHVNKLVARERSNSSSQGRQSLSASLASPGAPAALGSRDHFLPAIGAATRSAGSSHTNTPKGERARDLHGGDAPGVSAETYEGEEEGSSPSSPLVHRAVVPAQQRRGATRRSSSSSHGRPALARAPHNAMEEHLAAFRFVRRPRLHTRGSGPPPAPLHAAHAPARRQARRGARHPGVVHVLAGRGSVGRGAPPAPGRGRGVAGAAGDGAGGRGALRGMRALSARRDPRRRRGLGRAERARVGGLPRRDERQRTAGAVRGLAGLPRAAPLHYAPPQRGDPRTLARQGLLCRFPPGPALANIPLLPVALVSECAPSPQYAGLSFFLPLDAAAFPIDQRLFRQMQAAQGNYARDVLVSQW
jgi:hypothetical protein